VSALRQCGCTLGGANPGAMMNARCHHSRYRAQVQPQHLDEVKALACSLIEGGSDFSSKKESDILVTTTTFQSS
jgi:hypothetical protein